jgi:outer membrane protein
VVYIAGDGLPLGGRPAPDISPQFHGAVRRARDRSLESLEKPQAEKGRTQGTGGRARAGATLVVLAGLAASLAAPLPTTAESSGASAAPAGTAPAVAVFPEREAVSVALQQSPALEVARRELNVALIQAERAGPKLFPQVNATAGQIAQTPRVDLPGRKDEVVLPNFASRVAIELHQPVFQVGVKKPAEQRSEALAAAARSDFRKAELDTITQVREAYLGLIRAAEMTDVAQRGVELAKENIRLTRLLRERGSQADVDVLEAERAELEAQSNLAEVERGVVLARANLNQLLGREIDTPVSPALEKDLPPAPPALDELKQKAFAQRPEILGLKANIVAAEAGVELARKQSKPRVNFDASYVVQTETALLPGNGFSAGLSITMPLFDGTLRRYNVEEAKERVKQLQGVLAQAERGVEVELQSARTAMDTARRRIVLADKSVQKAQEAYDITLLRMERGRAIQAEMLNARLSLQRAMTDRCNALNDLHLARVRLDRALGEGPTSVPPPQDSSKR